jgi:thiol:disulfide interchange protein DsbG
MPTRASLHLLAFLAIFFLLAGLSGPVRAASTDHDEDFWQALTHTQYIAEGKQGPVVYLFLDPNCPYCHKLYDQLQGKVAKGKLRLRVVVVGFLSPSSRDKAAAILAAADPRAALAKNESGFAIRDGRPEGGIAPADSALVAKEAGILHRNFSFLQGKESLLDDVPPGAVTVPLLVYRRQGQLHYLVNLPTEEQWQEILNAK